MKLVEVAVAAPLNQTLTYKTSDTHDNLLPGTRLLVPLGRRFVTGYLLGPAQEEPTEYAVKKVKEVLDDTPLFPATMVPFFRWIANYYHHPIGEIIKTALPAGLTTQSRRWIRLTDAGKKQLSRLATKQHDAWLEDLLTREKLSPAATRPIWNSNLRKKLLLWQQDGYIEIVDDISKDTTRSKTETCVKLISKAVNSGEIKFKPSELKTIELITELSLQNSDLPKRDIIRFYAGARNALKSLAQKGVVSFFEKKIYRDPFGETLHFPAPPEKLTDEQRTALHQINRALDDNTFSPILLHGVTGSGKTEVYLQAVDHTLRQGKSALILVPEIALATQVEAHFLGRFNDQVALLHSGLTKGERYDQWLRIMNNEAQIVIGARSAVFAPLHNLGLIIVDEEHDSAYKQEDGLRYNGRDLAILRASQHSATVLLGSATPSLTTYTNAITGKYRKISLKKRVEDKSLPDVEVVDLQGVKTVSGQPPLFTPQLTAAIRQNLANREQTLVFLNRRGYANMMICKQCGIPVQCQHCHISLTLHHSNNALLCHYCGFTLPGATLCSNCQATEFMKIGFGTERIETELAKLFPQAAIARLDRDTTRKRSEFIALLKAVHHGDIDILVGTQMITKGHHFPNVTLVGVVWADAGLSMPDFKSGERTFQLLSQVTGRAGRGDKPGRVIIQTHQPQHYSIIAARSHDYKMFFDKESKGRKQLEYPPYARLINLGFESEQESAVQKGCHTLASLAAKKCRQFSVEVLGPAPALLSKLRGRYRWQLLLKGQNIERLHAFLSFLQNNLPPQILSNKVKMTVDVDPESMV